METAAAFVTQSREDPETAAEAEAMMRAAFEVRDRCDALLAGQSQHWDVQRMALVDRNILRLALWELLSASAPRKVVITEALRLAKEFSTAESARFINGVLDAASRRIETNDDSRDAGDAGD
jgi:N utilization substance protein B